MLAALMFAAAAATAPTTQQKLIDLETQSWAAWQKMDAGFWQRFLSDDHVEISGYSGATGKADVIRGISSKVCKVASYKVDHFTFRQFDSRTAVLVYRAEQDTTCGGFKVPSPVWATSLFQLRDGRWQNVVYEHTPVLMPPVRK
ncbi:MAG: nuclear transport factor 2 family protein [Sphingomonas sp.]